MVNNIRIMLPDGTVGEYPAGVTVREVAASLGAGMAKRAVGARIDGALADMSREISNDCSLELVMLDSQDGLTMYRHTAAHIMAQAIKRLYGRQKVKLGIGPVIEDGFYYDIELGRTLVPEDLASIEREMEAVIQEDLPIVRRVVSREEAVSLFNALGETLKLELIDGFPEDAVLTVYEQGEFIDLCRGPHLPSTGCMKAFKLLSVAGAYWRGDAGRTMLQRIYGTAFPKQRQLEEHLKLLAEAKKRDHRKLGKELGLFMFSEEASGMPFYLPKGMTIRTELENYSRELQKKRGYDEVRTPFMMNQRLWEQSGHWDHYHENMYFTEVDEARFALKPMNCPGHMLIYKNSLHSYRELPIRIAEFGQVHRHEYSGALSGMMRVRTFCQDDAHIFVRPDQIADEIKRIIELIDEMYNVFGFEYTMELSTRPEHSMGSVELWQKAEAALQNVLDQCGAAYRINKGDGAFYGPKIDFHIRDALKRSWQCATIQLDFQMPEKFDLSYIGEDGLRRRPVVIHRAVYGSIDRFIGILTEHYGGAFPLWLAPVQAKLLPVSDALLDYALMVKRELEEAGIRAQIDARSEKLGFRLREAQLEKVPYTLVLGDSERASGTASVRRRGAAEHSPFTVAALTSQLVQEIRSKL